MEYLNQKVTEDQQNQLLFMMLVQQHEQIGMMGLGKIKNPATDQIERDLHAAKYAIDTLAMLEKYTTGNLPQELAGYLRQKLSTLRLNYVDEKKAEETESRKVYDSEEPDPGADS